MEKLHDAHVYPFLNAQVLASFELGVKERKEAEAIAALDLPDKTEGWEQRERDHEIGWFNVTIEADHWAALSSITPSDAAMLLCRLNPNTETFEDAKETTADELGPENLIRLEQRLADLNKIDPSPRTLRDWLGTARTLGLKYHSWIDSYMEATPPPATSEAQIAARHAPVSNATPDPERRLALLRTFGGSAKYTSGAWRFTGIAALVASEESENRKRRTEKTIRADLKEAAQNERDANRAGFADGLGQR